MASCPPEQWKAECEDYLKGQGPWQSRARRYGKVEETLNVMGLNPGDLIVDVGAGMCDFARYMYGNGHFMRYLPLDGSIDGRDIEKMETEFPFGDWQVCIETVEHMHDPLGLLRVMAARANRGVVVTTPNPDVTDVLALDSDHKCAISMDDFIGMGYLPEAVSIHYQDDTILATWQKP